MFTALQTGVTAQEFKSHFKQSFQFNPSELNASVMKKTKPERQLGACACSPPEADGGIQKETKQNTLMHEPEQCSDSKGEWKRLDRPEPLGTSLLSFSGYQTLGCL